MGNARSDLRQGWEGGRGDVESDFKIARGYEQLEVQIHCVWSPYYGGRYGNFYFVLLDMSHIFLTRVGCHSVNNMQILSWGICLKITDFFQTAFSNHLLCNAR